MIKKGADLKNIDLLVTPGVLSNEILFFVHIIFLLFALIFAARISRGALLGLLGLQVILANLFVTKQISLFGMATTCSEVFIVSGMYGISIMRELYGEYRARWAIWSCFFFMFFFTVVSMLHVSYLSVSDPLLVTATHEICSYTPRLAFASLISYFISERVNLYAFNRLSLFLSHGFALHGAVVIGQFCDTVIFTLIGLWGVLVDPVMAIFVSITVKLITILFTVPFMNFARESGLFDR